MSRWRKCVGAERLEKLLETTIHTALAMKAVRPPEFQKVNVDTTVQEKAMAFPTDARLYHKMRLALVRRARQLGIPLRQNYRFKSQQLLGQAGPLRSRPADEASREDDPRAEDDLGPRAAGHPAKSSDHPGPNRR